MKAEEVEKEEERKSTVHQLFFGEVFGWGRNTGWDQSANRCQFAPEFGFVKREITGAS